MAAPELPERKRRSSPQAFYERGARVGLLRRSRAAAAARNLRPEERVD